MIEQLTLSEEVAIIIKDAFQGDSNAEKVCVQKLADTRGVTLSEMSEEEIQELILEGEDELYYLFELYDHDEL
jgi:hypothetical protein